MSIYFTDSKGGTQLSSEMAQRLIQRLNHPDFRMKQLLGGLAESAHMPYTGRKSYPANTIVGMNGLQFSVCEQMEYGYGIFTGYTDDEYMMTWLGPMMLFQDEQIKFKVIDWTSYLKNVGQRGSSATWGCSVGSYSDVPLQGCELNYCFEQDRHNKFGVPAGVRPSDTVEPCMVQPVMNVFGQRINDPVARREFALMTGVRLHMIDRVFDGDYCASSVETDKGQEDGVLKWFDNFPTRHQYLDRDCLEAMAPTTDNVPTTAAALTTALGYTVADTAAAIAEAKVEYTIRKVSSHISDLEWKIADIAGGGAVLGFDKIAVVMNPADAQCITWYQFCQVKCAGTTISVSSTAEMAAFYRDFQTKLHGGLYGAGTMRLYDGREISMMPMRRMPRGTVLVLVKGWDGQNANPYGLRLAAMQYNNWYSHVQRTVPQASLKYKLVLNGTGVRFEPTDFCTDIEVRWNHRLFSNAPWMQLKIIGLPACSEVNIPTWPTMPSLTTYTRCVPYGCEIVQN